MFSHFNVSSLLRRHILNTFRHLPTVVVDKCQQTIRAGGNEGDLPPNPRVASKYYDEKRLRPTEGRPVENRRVRPYFIWI